MESNFASTQEKFLRARVRERAAHVSKGNVVIFVDIFDIIF